MEEKIGLYNMAKIQETKTEWLWYPYIPYGKVTIIQGDPGEGKTTLALNIAAALTRGRTVTGETKDPITGEELYPCPVLFQTAEDGLGDTVKPRLLAADAARADTLASHALLEEVAATPKPGKRRKRRGRPSSASISLRTPDGACHNKHPPA